MSADISLIPTGYSFSFGLPSNPWSAAPIPQYFKWWLCFQKKMGGEKPQLHRKQNRTGCNLFHFITLYLLLPLSLDELGRGGGRAWGVAGMCSDWWRIFRRCYFHYLSGRNNISEAYLKVIIALSHLWPPKGFYIWRPVWLETFAAF